MHSEKNDTSLLGKMLQKQRIVTAIYILWKGCDSDNDFATKYFLKLS